MQGNFVSEEEKTQEKYTQFTPPYPNKYELELEEFPTFTDIEIKNPTKTQLSLRQEEAKRLNTVYDNNNNFSEDKNIKEILSNNFKNSNKYNDVYGIDLPKIFMRSSITNEKKEKIEEAKKDETEEKKETKDKPNYDDDYDIDINFTEKEMNDIKKEEINNENKNNIDENKIEKDNNYQMKYMDSEELNKHYKMYYIDENDFKEEILNKRKSKIESHQGENDLNNNNDDFEIEIDNEKEADLESKPINNLKVKKKPIKIKLKNNKNLNMEETQKENSHDITTLNINGLNSNEYYLGEIKEKGPNYPSTLGIVKYMNLNLFSENYFGEQLKFSEISKKDDFQEIIKLVPIGNKQYIFSNINTPKNEIEKEENDLIILHGKGGTETFYYIMKMTGNSEYTIYKLTNKKHIIKHFKDSIGLNNGDDQDKSQESNTEGIDYNINENPKIQYRLIKGQQFLALYRKIIKKEEEIERKKNELNNYKDFNSNFKTKYSSLEQYYMKKVEEKNMEIEQKIANIERLEMELNSLSKIETNNNEELWKINKEKKDVKKKEEELKLELNRIKNKYNILIDEKKQTEKIKNNYSNEIDEDEFNLENNGILNDSIDHLKNLKNELKNLREKIFCCSCKKKMREVIFQECGHLILCNNCFNKRLKNPNKQKEQCPICNKLNKRFFFIKN